MQDDPSIPDTYTSLRIGCRRGGQSLKERRLEMLQLLEPTAELRVDGRPGDGGGLAQQLRARKSPSAPVTRCGTPNTGTSPCVSPRTLVYKWYGHARRSTTAMHAMSRGIWGSGFVCFGSIRAASLVTGRFRSEETAVRSNKVTLIWGILTLISLLVVLVLMLTGVVSL